MNSKEVVFADDFSVPGSLNSIKDYWDKLTEIGPKYGYFPKLIKSFLIVKEKKLMEAQNLFANSSVNMIAERKRDLDAVIESTECRDEYVKDLMKDWENKLTILSTTAETQPQTAYLAFVSEFKSKLNFFPRTIPNIRHLLLPLERTIRNKFIHICSDKERVLIFLPTMYAGLAIPRKFHL